MLTFFWRSLRCAIGMLVWGAASAAWAQADLPDTVRAALRDADLPETAMAAVVLPLHGSSARLAHRADQAMAPASTIKLLTTAVALDELGPTFRWHTQLWAAQAPSGSRLRGPIYLRGGGDPNLTWQRLQMLLRELRAQGVRHWRGDLVLDRSYFLPQRPDIGLAPFDESPDAYYNVIPDALLLHSNLLELRLQSDAQRVQVQLRTPIQGVRVRSQITLIDGDCKHWDDGWLPPDVQADRGGSLLLTLQGRFVRNCKVDTSTNVLDRNQYIARVWQALWQELGGSWSGTVREGTTPATAQLLVDSSSESLADVVKIVNKRSDNSMARVLYLTLGAEYARRSEYPDHFAAARARVDDWLQRQGVSTRGLVLDNGSGLSRLERIAPQQLAQVLQAAARGPWLAEQTTGMPIVGVDGAMRRRLQGTAAQYARIKTGSLRDSAAVAGYVRDARGQTWVVVATINHADARRGRNALDNLIEWAARAPLE